MDPEISRDGVTMSEGEGRPGTLGQIVWESGYNRDVEGESGPRNIQRWSDHWTQGLGEHKMSIECWHSTS